VRKCCICEKDDSQTKIIKRQDLDYCRRHYLQLYKNNKIQERTMIDKNEYIVKNGYCEICLYNTKSKITGYAIIDISDIEKCKNIKWYLKKGNKTNYVYGKQLNNTIILHRFLLDYDGELKIDHINHNGLDNRKCNLRICEHKENIRNQEKDKIIGVRFCKQRNKFVAQIMKNNKSIFLGRFNTEKEAILARLKAEKEYFKEFAPQIHLFEEYNI